MEKEIKIAITNSVNTPIELPLDGFSSGIMPNTVSMSKSQAEELIKKLSESVEVLGGSTSNIVQKDMGYTKIPKSYKVGGQKMEVRRVDRCSDNSVGECCVAAGYIEVANSFSKDDVQSDDSKVNTFYHELTHSILRIMGETELNDNERFVCCFSSFLTEAMEKAYFMEEE